jgi:DNA invertase Pin-like site-specific DNA recombinase
MRPQRPPNEPLRNPKREAFVQAYVKNPENATDAYRLAGYRKPTRQAASFLLTIPDVQARIAWLQAQNAKKYELSRDRLVSELFDALEMARSQNKAGDVVAVVKELGVLGGLRIEQTSTTLKNVEDIEDRQELLAEQKRLREILATTTLCPSKNRPNSAPEIAFQGHSVILVRVRRPTLAPLPEAFLQAVWLFTSGDGPTSIASHLRRRTTKTPVDVNRIWSYTFYITRGESTMEGIFVAYYRVSTKRQSLGLDAQKAAVERYLNGGGWKLIGEFEEKETGTRHEQRDALKAAIALCKRKKATLVIAKLDRLARNVAFISNLMESRANFVACDNPNANTLTVHILAAVAEQEARDISARTKAALAARKAQGVKLGGPKITEAAAIGRERIAHRADVFAERLAPVVADARRRGITTLAAIAAELARLNWAKPRGGTEWTATDVRNLLKRLDV